MRWDMVRVLKESLSLNVTVIYMYNLYYTTYSYLPNCTGGNEIDNMIARQSNSLFEILKYELSNYE